MKKFFVLSFMVCMVVLTGCQSSNNPDEIIAQNLDNEVVNNEITSPENSNVPISNDIVPEENVLPTDDTTSVVEDEIKEEPVKTSETIKETVAKEIVMPKANDDGITVLKFKNTNSDDYIKTLNGKQVSITGYISTLSPLNGQFAYLMNMPYQNCPFCIPGTSEITNTLAIYAGNKSKIQFTDQPVTVVGTLEVGDFTDEFGYGYGVRLNNVTVNKADVDKLSDTVKKYNLLAENGVVNNIYGSIMTADMPVFYNYYNLEKPSKIVMDQINSTKSLVEFYNSNGDYNVLIGVMNDLITLCETVNKDIDNEDYSKFSTYQPRLQDIYYNFAMWMNEGEL